jgi:hypothetical protein
MHARGVEVVPEGGQLLLQVRRIPIEELIQILGPDASDESSTNGCDRGTSGTVCTVSMPKTRRLACQRWNWKSGSWDSQSVDCDVCIHKWPESIPGQALWAPVAVPVWMNRGSGI